MGWAAMLPPGAAAAAGACREGGRRRVGVGGGWAWTLAAGPPATGISREAHLGGGLGPQEATPGLR